MHKKTFFFTVLTMLTAVLLTGSHAHAKNTLSDLLDTHRWREYSHGVSIRPPLGSQVQRYTADSAIVRIHTRDNYDIHLFIKQAKHPLTLIALRREALKQMAKIYPAARLLVDRTFNHNKAEALALHFLIPKSKNIRWVTAQTFVRLDEQSWALLQLETPHERYELAKPTYEAVIQSLQIENPEKLARQRQQQLDAGNALRKEIDYTDLKKQLIGEQWFRFVQGDLDIGYLRIRQSHGPLDNRLKKLPTYLAQPGLHIEVLTRILLQDTLYDSISLAFLSDDNAEEIWSIRTTERPLKVRTAKQLRAKNNHRIQFEIKTVPTNQNHLTWVQTGIRSRGKIEVIQQQRTRNKKNQWKVPTHSYLSQVDLYLLPLIFKNRPNGTWGFYAYHPNTGKISYRTERLEKLDHGRFRIYSRLTPEDIQEQITLCDEHGRILERTLPGGRKLIAATLRQIKARWPQFVEK